MQGIYTYIPETNHVPREYSVSAILSLLFMVPISLVPALALLYFTLVIIIIIIIIIITIIIIIGCIFNPAMQLLCETLTPGFCEIPFGSHLLVYNGNNIYLFFY